MKKKFIDWKPMSKTVLILARINDILDEYQKQGYVLTLRQLYYQLVSRDIIPNKLEEYSKLGNIVSKGRLSGMIDWSMIEDRLRFPQKNSHWNTPSEILRSAAHSFYMDKWTEQKNYVEVWCEKDAVSNIIKPICKLYDITFMANRGYSSQSAMYDAFKRLNQRASQGKNIRIIYLGDHDPSGIDMTNDIKNRLGTFFFKDDSLVEFVDRAALNLDQIEIYKPPENPAKVTDSRYDSYVGQFGVSSWELDALEPKVLSQIVTDAIMEFIDTDEFDRVQELEEGYRDRLIEIADEFDEEE